MFDKCLTLLLLAFHGQNCVSVHHVPRRVVDGRCDVHVQLVHRGVGLAQEAVGRVEAGVRHRVEVNADL